jgi:hypothetical protein
MNEPEATNDIIMSQPDPVQYIPDPHWRQEAEVAAPFIGASNIHGCCALYTKHRPGNLVIDFGTSSRCHHRKRDTSFPAELDSGPGF